MRKKLLHNWGLKLISLLLAFVLWFLVVLIDNPPDSNTYSNIQVKLTNTELLDQENKVYEVLDNTDTVRVTINAPKTVISDIRASDIVAEADFSKLTDINTVIISYYVQNYNNQIDSISGNHDVVKLNVENKKSKWIKLDYDVTGEVAEGYMVASASPDQTLIEVTGPESAIDKISYAHVEIGVDGATSDLSANVEIQLYDAENVLLDLPSVKKNVSYVHMNVDVLAKKEVPIELNVMGVPAEGYLATGVVESNPATVSIAGSVSALANISKISIPEDELNITGESSDMTDIINIREYLPDNIRLADSTFNGRITATVYIEPEVSKTLEIPVGNITVTNTPEGFDTLLPEDLETLTLKVSGLGAQITPLTQNTIRGTIDVAAWMTEQEITEISPGTYTIPVTFNLSEEVTIEENVTVRVTVNKVVSE